MTAPPYAPVAPATKMIFLSANLLSPLGHVANGLPAIDGNGLTVHITAGLAGEGDDDAGDFIGFARSADCRAVEFPAQFGFIFDEPARHVGAYQSGRNRVCPD